MRTLLRTTPACIIAGALLLTLPWTAPTSADDSVYFSAKFFNDSAVSIKVEILHTDGSLQKDDRVNPGNHKTFHFGSTKCKYTKTRRFRIYERLNNTVIATGMFAMTSGPSIGWNECNPDRSDFQFLECADTPNDAFAVRCALNEKDREGRRGMVYVASGR
ncbi:MAG TPA: hypothetical protein VF198_02965 [Vicinamibacterales bacterium]